jgi:hypothetical protein
MAQQVTGRAGASPTFDTSTSSPTQDAVHGMRADLYAHRGRGTLDLSLDFLAARAEAGLATPAEGALRRQLELAANEPPAPSRTTSSGKVTQGYDATGLVPSSLKSLESTARSTNGEGLGLDATLRSGLRPDGVSETLELQGRLEARPSSSVVLSTGPMLTRKDGPDDVTWRTELKSEKSLSGALSGRAAVSGQLDAKLNGGPPSAVVSAEAEIAPSGLKEVKLKLHARPEFVQGESANLDAGADLAIQPNPNLTASVGVSEKLMSRQGAEQTVRGALKLDAPIPGTNPRRITLDGDVSQTDGRRPVANAAASLCEDVDLVGKATPLHACVGGKVTVDENATGAQDSPKVSFGASASVSLNF